MVKTHHGSNIILMAVSAFFHPIFGYLVVSSPPWWTVETNGRGWGFTGYPSALWPFRVLFKPYTSLAASQVPTPKIMRNLKGMRTKIGCPKKRTDNFFVHVIYRNINAVVWFKWFFLPLQSVVAQKKTLLFSSIGCQHGRFVPRSQTYVFYWYLIFCLFSYYVSLKLPSMCVSSLIFLFRALFVSCSICAGRTCLFLKLGLMPHWNQPKKSWQLLQLSRSW